MTEVQNHATAKLNEKKASIILVQKITLIRLWTSIFYSSNHLCIVDFATAKAMKGEQITEDDLGRFQNHENMVAELKEGFILADATQKRCYEVNFRMFEFLPTLIEKIKKIIKSEMQLYNLNAQKQKICADCGASKQITLIQSGFRCDKCGSDDFCEIKHDLEKKRRLETVQNSIVKVITMREDIERQTAEFQKEKYIHEQQEKQKAIRKVSRYNQFVGEIERKLGLERVKDIKAEHNNSYFRDFTDRQLSPLNSFKRVEELTEIRRKRKLVKTEYFQ